MSSGFSPNPFVCANGGTNGGLQIHPPDYAFAGFQAAEKAANKLKMKRARQRVDAGEPRNTYSTIPNYTSGRIGFPPGTPTGLKRDGPSPLKTSTTPGLPPLLNTDAVSSSFASFGMQNLLKLHQEQQQKQYKLACRTLAQSNSPGVHMEEAQETAVDFSMNRRKQPTLDESYSQAEVKQEQAEEPESMRDEGTKSTESSEQTERSSSGSRRKQSQPLQLESMDDLIDFSAGNVADQTDRDSVDSNFSGDKIPEESSPAPVAGSTIVPNETTVGVETVVRQMQAEILQMQQRYLAALTAQQQALTADRRENGFKGPQKLSSAQGTEKELKLLAEALKSEFAETVNKTVDKIVNFYMDQLSVLRSSPENSPAASPAVSAPLEKSEEIQRTPEAPPVIPAGLPDWSGAPQFPFYLNPLYYNALSFVSQASGVRGQLPGGGPSIFPPHFRGHTPNFSGGLALANPGSLKSEEAVPLIVTKKKRSKVTDTRISKFSTSSMKQEEVSPLNYHPPTMVPHYPTMLSAAHSRYLPEDSEEGSPTPSDAVDMDSSIYESGSNQSVVLSPMHLRKAKLMFFYTRYPSSSLLKAFFPDIRFTKNNTAQLVKWFSNFREFYYIQMEKYARQALDQGIRYASEITITTESELYRVLNLHYNRNNHIIVPANFRAVVEATLREFFKAVQEMRDAEPSWKKAIYKIIARLDDPIPDYFKSPTFLDTLEG